MINIRCILILAVCYFVIPVSVLGNGAIASTSIDAERLARAVTIYRDSYGVPHVFGHTDESTVFGFAYAQAEDNFWRIEENFILALGRASELYGEETLADVLRGSRTLSRAPRHAQGGSAGDRSRWDHARSDPPQRRWPTLHVVVLPPRPAGVGTPPLTQGAPRDKNA